MTDPKGPKLKVHSLLRHNVALPSAFDFESFQKIKAKENERALSSSLLNLILETAFLWRGLAWPLIFVVIFHPQFYVAMNVQ